MFCNPNPVQNFHWVIRSEPNPVDLSKYLIQSGLYKKKLWLSMLLQWSTQFGYPYLIRLSFFRNPVRYGSGSELRNSVGLRSGNRIRLNTGTWCEAEVAGVTFSVSESAPVPKFLNPGLDPVQQFFNLRIRLQFRLRLQSSIQP